MKKDNTQFTTKKKSYATALNLWFGYAKLLQKKK